jgi:hypothetical protein
MEKVKPKFTMIIMYGIVFGLVISLILLYIERNSIVGYSKTDPILLLLLLVGLSFIGGISLSIRTFMRRYYIIEVDEKVIIGPSLFGAGWRRITIPINEIHEITINPFLVFIGIYIIKSIKGEIICITGFDEEKMNILLKLIGNGSNSENK